MRVAQRVDANSGDEIQISLAIQIVNIGALPTMERQRIAAIILKQVFPLQFHHGLRSGQVFDRCGGHFLIIDEMKTMQAWQVTAWGEPEQMTFGPVAVPEPGAGEIRIANRAAALNFFDILQIQGKYQVKPPFPFTPGAEAAGVVDAVGSGVTRVSVGDQVLAMPMGGAFAECSISVEGKAFRIPGGMDFAEAAAMPIVYHTSYFALVERGRAA